MERQGADLTRLISLCAAALAVATSWVTHQGSHLIVAACIVTIGTVVSVARAFARPTAPRILMAAAAVTAPASVALGVVNGRLAAFTFPPAPWGADDRVVRLPIEVTVGLFAGALMSTASIYLEAMRVLPASARVRSTLDTLMSAVLAVSASWQLLDLSGAETANLAPLAPALCVLVVEIGFHAVAALNSIDGRRDRILAASLGACVATTSLSLAWPSAGIVEVAAPSALSLAVLAHTTGLATAARHRPRPYPRATRMRWRQRMKASLIVGSAATALFAMRDGDFALHNAILSYAILILFFFAERSAENESLSLHEELERRLADLEARKEQLRLLAETDELTGLRNRRSFLKELDTRLSGTDDGVVAFIDLDGFKDVNDSLGHDAGDELLVACARRLVASAGPDATVARLGGDELAVLFSSCAAESALAVSNRLLTALRQPVGDGVAATVVTASIGVACATVGSTTSRVLADADMAMYEAKAAGGDRVVVFDERLRTALAAHSTVAVQLAGAVDRAEIVAHFQPVVALADESLRGFEALMRWRHPERGLMAPDAFLHIADDTDLIRHLGREVLESACGALARWRMLGLVPADATIRVNLATHQLNDPAMCDIVRAALDSSGVDAANLILEVHDSAWTNDRDAEERNLARLAATGVALSIDNLGTGYSSLADLKRLPIRELKVDRSFVAGVPDRRDDMAIVSAVIGLAEGLGCTTVAEGVEREVQAATLRSLGCQSAQGFLFAAPMAAADIEQWLSRAPARRQERTNTGAEGVDLPASNR